MFETEVMPVVVRYARGAFREDEERVAVALVLAWWMWTRRPQDYAPTHWAHLAVRAVFAGRDLPRAGTTRAKDAIRRAVSGGLMEELPDRRPGPAQLAEDRERVELLESVLTPRERRMAELLAAGVPAARVAESLALSAGRITQIRQELMERLEDLE